jgi:methionyl-tRNA formyltransferase
MNVAFFGSPRFALSVLEPLNQDHEVALVVSQPDKRAGRGMKVTSPAVVEKARTLGLNVRQPERLKGNDAFAKELAALELDVAITAAYGKILPASLLEIPKHGFLNVHASLLPKYRGAAPIQWALIEGESETGVTIMQTAAGMDTGDIRHVKRLAITDDDDAQRLFDKLALLGATALTEALDLLAEGKLPSIPQDDAQATHAPMLTKEDGQINWQTSARAIFNRHRGVSMWPKSWLTFQEKTVKVPVLELLSDTSDTSHHASGTVLDVHAEGIDVVANPGVIRLVNVQPSGKAAMEARAFANGYGIKAGVCFG